VSDVGKDECVIDSPKGEILQGRLVGQCKENSSILHNISRLGGRALVFRSVEHCNLIGVFVGGVTGG